jgi:hypothetical protein
MKIFFQTIANGFVLSFLFTTLSFAQFESLKTGNSEIYTVTFNVDMSLAVVCGFSPSEHSVFLTGSLTNWAEPGTEGSIEMVQIFQKSNTIILFESFKNGFPAGWLSVDNDGDGYEWMVINYNSANGDNAAIMSASYDNSEGPLTPDNWLITSAIEGVTKGYRLSFWVSPQDPYWPAETYSVLVSTSGTDLADFTTEIHSATLDDIYWTKVCVALAEFEGEDIYIAFRHYNSIDWFQILIDDISVEEFEVPEEIIYTATLELEEGDYEYMYFTNAFGEGWDGAEWYGDSNRVIYVLEDMIQEDLWILSYNVPTIITATVSNITHYSATCGGRVTYDGCADVSSRGVVWSIYEYPTIATHGGIKYSGSGSGSFLSNIAGLSENTTYFIRAFAKNCAGTSYGNQQSFKTLKFTNIDENIINRISVYPNPFNDIVTIKSDVGILKISVYNIEGQKVFEVFKNGEFEDIINLQEVTEGFYILKITDVEGRQINRKIVK